MREPGFLDAVETGNQTQGLVAQPKPVPEKTTICFSLAETQQAGVEVYDVQGREVATLFQEEVKAKQAYEGEWKPSEKTAGLYILRL